MNRINRRDLLAAFLGAPALTLAGCGSRSAPAPIPGELVGTSIDFGHRLRNQAAVQPGDDQWEQTDVAIVGAGVAGLSAARRLIQLGVERLVVLEIEPAPGGTSRSGQRGGFKYPWGAHYLPVPLPHNQELIQLLAEMRLLEGDDDDGLPIVAEQHLCRDPQERLFYKGTWTEGLYLEDGASEEDRRQLLLFEQLIQQWTALRDDQDRRAFVIPMADCSPAAEVRQLDQISMGQWMRQQGFDSPRLLWLIEYSCRDDYGMTMDEVSAWAGLFYFCARVPDSGDDSQPFITWPEGNGRLVEHLRQRLGERLRLSQAAADLAPIEQEGRTQWEIATLDGSGAARGYRASHVVFAAPRFVAPYVIRPWRRDPPAHVAEFSYSSWVVANLLLKDRPLSRGFPLSWDNVLYDSPSLGYVTATHQSDQDYGPTVLTYYYPLCGGDARDIRQRLQGTGQAEWAEIAVSDLARAHHDFRSLVERVDVMRWGHAMVQPRRGFMFGGAREQACESYRGLHFAHSDLSGLPLFEEAFYRGNRAADAVFEHWKLQQQQGAPS